MIMINIKKILYTSFFCIIFLFSLLTGCMSERANFQIGQEKILDGVKVKIISVIDSKGDDSQRSGRDNIFLIIKLEILNESGNVVKVNPIKFKLKVDDVFYEFEKLRFVADPLAEINLKPSEKVIGKISYKIPSNNKVTILTWNPEFKDVVFEIKIK